MNKKCMHAGVVVIFGLFLAMYSLRGSYTEQQEMAELQDAMRNLRRVDNLQLTSSYTYFQGGVAEVDRVDVWVDMLSGLWVSESFATDEDGTRLYLRQFCDGRSLYNYMEWTGEWMPQSGGNTAAPNLESITVLTYREDDILETKTEEKDGYREITYTFTPEYLGREHEKRLAEMKKAYAEYESIGAEGEAFENMERTVQQFAQSYYKDITVTYKIDKEQILRGLECNATWMKPALETAENGEVYLGEEESVELQLVLEVVRYDQDGTLNKIEQCRNELGY